MFAPLTWPLHDNDVAKAGSFLSDARERFSRSGFEVQTVRLAAPPFMDVLGKTNEAALLTYAQSLERLATQHAIDFVSLGPLVATSPLTSLRPISWLTQLISETRHVFSGVLLADSQTGINLAAAQAFAQVVHDVAQSTPQGFGNLRLAALANVKPHTPFFPAAYHDGTLPTFAIATEAADLALNGVNQARSLNQAALQLTAAIESTVAQLLQSVDGLVDDHQMGFSGIDFSLAPYPSPSTSIGAVMERLGLDNFGAQGTLFVTSFLTRCIKQAAIPHVGFSGIMLPILEDSILAQRAESGSYTVNELLSYSAVCGTGLDTVPIPGDTTPDQLAALFLDMAALATTLDKPLTARLMPIPGLKAGQEVDFDFDFFVKGKILPLKQTHAAQLIKTTPFLTANTSP